MEYKNNVNISIGQYESEYNIKRNKDENNLEKVAIESNLKVYENFYNETVLYAKRHLNDFPEDSVSYLLLKFYSNDFPYFFKTIWDGEKEDSSLHEIFWEKRRDYKNDVDFQFQIFSGAYLPVGNLGSIGYHLIIGGAFFSFQTAIFQLDLVGSLRLLSSMDKYTVMVMNTEQETDYYFGRYLGVEVSCAVFRSNIVDIQLLAGLGYEDFNTLSYSYELQKWLRTFNVNTGLGLRIYSFKKINSFINIQARYNFLFYKNDGGTDLSGGACAIRIGFGTKIRTKGEKRLTEMHVY